MYNLLNVISCSLWTRRGGRGRWGRCWGSERSGSWELVTLQ